MVGFTIKPKRQIQMIDVIYNYRQNSMSTVEHSTEWSKHCVPFEKSLTKEQLITFHKLLDIQSETSAVEMRAVYKAGFKDGVALIKEIQE